ncbi:hypothetical protein [Streptomyces sp. 4F14]|uniref:hypothetical protein n=1 Tax=Streptomyces sp. 4F14 TaxID=3394380 RepID=UPI003A89D72D
MLTVSAPHAAEALSAHRSYTAFPIRVAPLLTTHLTAMREYAERQSHIALWADTACQVHYAICAVCFSQSELRPKYRRIAGRVVLNAIVAYEEAYVGSLARDEAGEYHPAPGTEYTFSISDIARAAADLLGEKWCADSGAWGVRGYLQADGESHGYTLGVALSGVLHVETSPEGDGRDLFDVCSADRLSSLAVRVADAIRELRKAD